MNSAEKLAILRLARTPGVGPITYLRLRAKFGSAQEICAAAPHWLKADGSLCTPTQAEQELRTLEHNGGTLLVLGEEHYPAQLAEVPDAPLSLSVLGNPGLLATRQVGMVGNRSASAAGLAWSRELARTLAAQGISITSGLARGIDTAVHEGALQAGGGTVAVVAGGVDHIYPPENKKLREEIIARGAVVSEQPWGAPPTAQMFPRRNRIIAGLSVGVVVSEATLNSGSLITAQQALEYGRDVFAVPGSPSDPRAAGPNWLLKNGATLIENAADVLGNLPHRAAPYVAPARAAPQPDLFGLHQAAEDEAAALPTAPDATPRQAVYGLLGRQPIDADTLARSSGVGEIDLNMLLTDLELDGLAVREADGRWRRA